MELLRTLNKSVVDVVEIENENFSYAALWLQPLLQSTAVLRGCFKIVPFNQGFLVHAGQFEAPACAPTHGSAELQRQISQIQDLHLSQAEMIGFKSVASLNRLST